ncbi:MAG: molybdenum cofactor biosynthesis protein MoaE [Rickettsiales bacterium]|nr:molybdenum cofactor biosynthesis protein MoaE [Rickettsiales bacterium]
MKIIFQKKKIYPERELKYFSMKNKLSGSTMSFLGKVRNHRNKKKIMSMEIEFYERMALFQTKKVLKKIIKVNKINDYLVMHRFGRLSPGDNIILILVASEHRKESNYFLNKVVDYFKTQITFWKKENFEKNSRWVKQSD